MLLEAVPCPPGDHVERREQPAVAVRVQAAEDQPEKPVTSGGKTQSRSRSHRNSFLHAARARASTKNAPQSPNAMRYVGWQFAHTRISGGNR